MSKFSIGRFFGKGPGSDPSTERRSNKRICPADTCSVLIVEDSKTVQHVMRRMLTQAGIHVRQAFDGSSGVALAVEHKPTMIFMDIVMPGLNGFQAIRQLRRNPITANTPIVVMSGNEEATQEYWVLKLGANGFMGKPFTRRQLFSHVERVLVEENQQE